MDRKHKRGDFMVGGTCASREHHKLRRQFPHFENTLKAAGPSPAEVKRLELEAANRELEARVAAFREKAKAFLKATGRRP